MKLKILISCIVFILIACSTDKNPVNTIVDDYDVYIRPTSEIIENYQEFSFTNVSDHTLYFNGFSKATPFYAAQMQNDTGWVHYVYWRCPVGSEQIEFISGETIKINVNLPPDNLPWKVGLSVRKEPDGERYYCWSAVQN